MSQRKKILIINNIEEHLPFELIKLYHQKIKTLESLGYQVEKITIPKKIRDHLQITYLIICSSELVSHLNSLQGITYGVKGDTEIPQKRSQYLGNIVKQRLLIGAYFLEQQPELIEKAQRMRGLVNKWIKKIFRTSEFLIFPSTNGPAPRADIFNHSFSGLISSHWSDNLLILSNFAGLPSLSLPIGLVAGLPVSININGAYGKDENVLELAAKLEE
ncbi:MAG: glutamyl-tRNA(Gln) amidotransferase subunit A [Mycoplasmataceae bacterium RC_NB112A]|nr:MAG: glutamyl-tRNA(Gln) amidotransferase subunit A [Mycoplasmataceae bacterium RC_NB112A]